jgi:GMP synthase-like glutamine amidotransferase
MSNGLPRIVVFQHVSSEHPGIFRDFLREEGIGWDVVEWDEGEVTEDVSGYDALWVMGGPQDVWEVDKYPWLTTEMAVIRRAVVDDAMPFLGFCLGHQLLAEALGGAVGPSQTPEVGVMDVELTEAGKRSPFMTNVPERSKYLQWHSAEVTQAPEDAEILAASAACPFQSMSVGDHAFSMQFHVELTPTTVRDWAKLPAYERALEKALGQGALERLTAETDARMESFNREARQLYDNFMRQLR